MRKNLFILLGIFAFVLMYPFAKAQNLPLEERYAERKDQIEQVKKEFITNRINLSPEQEENFWPVYENYTREKIRIKRNEQQIRRDNFNITASDEQLTQAIDKIFELKQQELDLEKEYRQKLLETINIRQLAELYRSEQDFLREVIKVLRRK